MALLKAMLMDDPICSNRAVFTLYVIFILEVYYQI